ncbi:MAG: pitrilysin family protein [Phocaeicola sp.]|nr:insulinase family protein [Phocaeicola sp.]MDD7448300.1 pitrilysin family protein [Prevotellaceae bacterium]MDY3915003.1 pitrilysin family protein [Phocaeicola sp.]MDY5938515.1 pitrilysin family protein [Phocaeicola sp.]
MIQINKYTLSNGLRIVHHEDLSTQMVAINIAYNVGARDEDASHTGFAHLFEHLMFCGSLHIPEYDVAIQEAGGENNAWTSNDLTNYYLTLPYPNAEIGFWLESDRMLGLDFEGRGLEVQRQVVMEEFRQRSLNQPYGDLNHLIRNLAYRVHPYKWPTIGLELAHIEKATKEEVKSFFYRFYAPNNAILAVTGRISFQETIRLAEKWFGDIPAREVKIRRLPIEPLQTEQRRKTVERNVPAHMLYMAFKMGGRTDIDYYPSDMLSDLLSNGSSSRLIQRLVKEKKLFSSIDAHIDGSIDPGLFHITGRLAENISFQEAEEAIWQELKNLQENLVEDFELEKIKNKYESQQIFNRMSYLNVATDLAYYELIGDAELINTEVECYRSVSKENIRAVAQKLFAPQNSNIIHYYAKQ